MYKLVKTAKMLERFLAIVLEKQYRNNNTHTPIDWIKNPECESSSTTRQLFYGQFARWLQSGNASRCHVQFRKCRMKA